LGRDRDRASRGTIKLNQRPVSPKLRFMLGDILLFSMFLLIFDRIFFFGINRLENKLVRRESLAEMFRGTAAKVKYPIMILGTSRTFEAIHPWYIFKRFRRPSFKEAYVGKGPLYNYHFYLEYKKHFPPPELLLYGVDYFIFAAKSSSLFCAHFGIGLEHPGYFSSPLLLLAQKPWIDDSLNNGLLALQRSLFGTIRGRVGEDQKAMAQYKGVSRPGRLVRQRPLRFAKMPYKKFPGREGRYFKALLGEWRRDHVRVCLVILPDYVGTLETNFAQEKFKKDIRDLTGDYANVAVWDFSDPRVFPVENPEYFINGGYGLGNSHLSRAGACRLNALLLEKMKAVLSPN
jgi:hypothetical protein